MQASDGLLACSLVAALGCKEGDAGGSVPLHLFAGRAHEPDKGGYGSSGGKGGTVVRFVGGEVSNHAGGLSVALLAELGAELDNEGVLFSGKDPHGSPDL